MAEGREVDGCARGLERADTGNNELRREQIALFALRDFETVARAANGLEVARIFRIHLDFLTDASHINVDGARSYEAGIAPYCIEEVVTAEDASGVTGEVIQEAKLGGGGGCQFATDLQLHSIGVDDDFFEADNGRRGGSLEATQDGLDAGDQFAGSEWLGDVVVGSEFEAQDAIIFASARGEEDNWHSGEGGMITQSAANIETISTGNHDVQQKESRNLSLCVGDEIGRGMENTGSKARCLQVMLHETRNISVVF